MKIYEVDYLTSYVVTPVHRDYPAKHLSKSSDKVMFFEDFVVKVYWINDEGGFKESLIRVPEGYVTDGASIPRVFHRIYHPFITEARWASGVHDYIYSHLYHEYPKSFADDLLKFMIERDGGSWVMRNSFYTAVRINIHGGGWKHG
jgi:hypothetical protein